MDFLNIGNKMDLIIGAGVSGISYATFSNNDYCIVEASDEIGGYCKTVKKMLKLFKNYNKIQVF